MADKKITNISIPFEGARGMAVSRIGCTALPFLKSDIPSEYVPFNGNFPLLGEVQINLLRKEIKKTDELDNCPTWVRNAILTGYNMAILESGFKAWLRDNGLFTPWPRLKKEVRARYVAMWMNASCLDPLRLNISSVVPAAV